MSRTEELLRPMPPPPIMHHQHVLLDSAPLETPLPYGASSVFSPWPTTFTPHPPASSPLHYPSPSPSLAPVGGSPAPTNGSPMYPPHPSMHSFLSRQHFLMLQQHSQQLQQQMAVLQAAQSGYPTQRSRHNSTPIQLLPMQVLPTATSSKGSSQKHGGGGKERRRTGASPSASPLSGPASSATPPLLPLASLSFGAPPLAPNVSGMAFFETSRAGLPPFQKLMHASAGLMSGNSMEDEEGKHGDTKKAAARRSGSGASTSRSSHHRQRGTRRRTHAAVSHPAAVSPLLPASFHSLPIAHTSSSSMGGLALPAQMQAWLPTSSSTGPATSLERLRTADRTGEQQKGAAGMATQQQQRVDNHMSTSAPTPLQSLHPVAPASPAPSTSVTVPSPPAPRSARKTLTAAHAASLRSAYLSVGSSAGAPASGTAATSTSSGPSSRGSPVLSRRASYAASESLTAGLPVSLVSSLRDAGLVSTIFSASGNPAPLGSAAATAAAAATSTTANRSHPASTTASVVASRRASVAPIDETAVGDETDSRRNTFPWNLVAQQQQQPQPPSSPARPSADTVPKGVSSRRTTATNPSTPSMPSSPSISARKDALPQSVDGSGSGGGGGGGGRHGRVLSLVITTPENHSRTIEEVRGAAAVAAESTATDTGRTSSSEGHKLASALASALQASVASGAAPSSGTPPAAAPTAPPTAAPTAPSAAPSAAPPAAVSAAPSTVASPHTSAAPSVASTPASSRPASPSTRPKPPTASLTRRSSLETGTVASRSLPPSAADVAASDGTLGNIIYITRESVVKDGPKSGVLAAGLSAKEQKKLDDERRERKLRAAEREAKKKAEAEEKRAKEAEALAAKEAARIAREKKLEVMAQQGMQRQREKEAAAAAAAQLEREEAERASAALAASKSLHRTPAFMRRLNRGRDAAVAAEESEARRRVRQELDPTFEGGAEGGAGDDSAASAPATPSTPATAAATTTTKSSRATARMSMAALGGKSLLSSLASTVGAAAALRKKAPTTTAAAPSLPFLLSARMIVASKSGDVDELRLLLSEEGVSAASASATSFLNRVDRNGSSALFHAIWPGHEHFIRTLLEYGASPDLQNVRRNTTMHLGVERGHDSIVRLLLRYGANPLLTNLAGAAPFQVLPSREDQLEWVGFIFITLDAIWKSAHPEWVTPSISHKKGGQQEAGEEKADEREEESSSSVSADSTDAFDSSSLPQLDDSLDHTPLANLSSATPAWLNELARILTCRDPSSIRLQHTVASTTTARTKHAVADKDKEKQSAAVLLTDSNSSAHGGGLQGLLKSMKHHKDSRRSLGANSNASGGSKRGSIDGSSGGTQPVVLTRRMSGGAAMLSARSRSPSPVAAAGSRRRSQDGVKGSRSTVVSSRRAAATATLSIVAPAASSAHTIASPVVDARGSGTTAGSASTAAATVSSPATVATSSPDVVMASAFPHAPASGGDAAPAPSPVQPKLDASAAAPDAAATATAAKVTTFSIFSASLQGLEAETQEKTREADFSWWK